MLRSFLPGRNPSSLPWLTKKEVERGEPAFNASSVLHTARLSSSLERRSHRVWRWGAAASGAQQGPRFLENEQTHQWTRQISEANLDGNLFYFMLEERESPAHPRDPGDGAEGEQLPGRPEWTLPQPPSLWDWLLRVAPRRSEAWRGAEQATSHIIITACLLCKSPSTWRRGVAKWHRVGWWKTCTCQMARERHCFLYLLPFHPVKADSRPSDLESAGGFLLLTWRIRWRSTLLHAFSEERSLVLILIWFDWNDITSLGMSKVFLILIILHIWDWKRYM